MMLIVTVRVPVIGGGEDAEVGEATTPGNAAAGCNLGLVCKAGDAAPVNGGRGG